MSSTKTLSKFWSPRWIATARSCETDSASIMIPEVDNKSLLPSEEPAGKMDQTSDALSVLKNMIQIGFTKKALSEIISKRSISAPPTPSRKVIATPHSTTPGQCFAEAMTECHSSVNQFYGLESAAATSKDDMSILLTKNTSSLGTDTRNRRAEVASKRARINEAKAVRISLIETNQRMRSLTLNVLTPGISVVSRMTRIRELCDHALNYPNSRTVAVKVSL